MAAKAAKRKPKSAQRNTLKAITNKFEKGTIRVIETSIDEIETDDSIEAHEFVGDKKPAGALTSTYDGTEVKVVFTKKGVIIVPTCGDTGAAIDLPTLEALVKHVKDSKH